MRAKDKVVLLHEIKESLDGSVIPEGAKGTIVYKMGGMGRNTYEIDFGKYGMAVCDKKDIALAPKENSEKPSG